MLSLSAAACAQDNKSDTFPFILHDDYSNRKPVDISVMLNDNMRMAHNTLVIIDDRIYSTSDPHFTGLDKSRIKTMRVIKDKKAATQIKNVIIIITK